MTRGPATRSPSPRTANTSWSGPGGAGCTSGTWPTAGAWPARFQPRPSRTEVDWLSRPRPGWSPPTGGRSAKGAAFSPDGNALVVVSGEGVARVWDTRGWAERAGFAWDIGPLRCIAFSPDGQRAAYAGHRGVIMVWDWDA